MNGWPHDPFNIHLCGVGGQGIGLLAATLLRAIAPGGAPVRGVDTHGLAQRGGIVVSQLRVGARAHNPVVSPGEAHLVLALERHEALRALTTMLAPGGRLLYADVEWQPLPVRLGRANRVTADEIARAAALLGAQVEAVAVADLPDPRCQNVALLAAALRAGALPGLTLAGLGAALAELLAGPALAANLDLLRRLAVPA